MSTSLIIRADAGPVIGAGHVMRCLALAQAWQDAGSGRVVFVLGTAVGALERRLVAQGCEVTGIGAAAGTVADAEETCQIATRCGARWVVVDGYTFGLEYQRVIKQSGLQLLVMDDYGHAGRYEADLVLNQNVYADPAVYGDKGEQTRLLLGSRFALLRREFSRWQGWQRAVPAVARKILVSMGGADPDNATLKAVQALQRVGGDGLEVTVVLGSCYAHEPALCKQIDAGPIAVRMERNVTDMSGLMALSDLAVVAGGSTCWELAFMGLPAVVVILANNQVAVGQALQERGMVVNAGWHFDLTVAQLADICRGVLADPVRRATQVAVGRSLVDGDGAARAVMAMTGSRFRLRRATEADRATLWEFSNDPVVRAASFLPAAIPWEDHVRWFASKIANPASSIFMVVDDQDRPAGQVRFERDGDESEISFSLAEHARGQGNAAEVIRAATRHVLRTQNIRRIKANIKSGNERSLRSFLKAGFTRAGSSVSKNAPAELLVLERGVV